MSELKRDLLPEPRSYYEGEGLRLVGRGPWRTTSCAFHGGSDSMRLHLERGAFVCMACGAKGGDVLAYHMAAHALGFVEAAKALGAYHQDAHSHKGPNRPAQPSARALLQLAAEELMVASVLAADMGRGRRPTAEEKDRLLSAAGRIGYIAKVANAQ